MMPHETAVAEHWEKDDVYALILSALQKTGKATQGLTVEDLAPVDHFHARGFSATVELADQLPITPDSCLLDIGCGLGGPARYFAERDTVAFVRANATVLLPRDVPVEKIWPAISVKR